MKKFVNFILKLSWSIPFGRSIKYFLKHRTQLYLKKTGWTLTYFETSNNIFNKKWKKLNVFGWFSIKQGFKYIDGLADPFLFIYKNKLFLFFEIEITKGKGEIWGARIEGNSLKNPQKIIEEPFHMSFPLVFKEQETIFMLPESSEDKSVRLYKAKDFPYKWSLEKILFSGKLLADINFLEKEGVYYWFCYDLDIKKTRLYYSSGLYDKWVEHSESPFLSNRNAGSIFTINNRLYRPIQIEYITYGEGVELREIISIDKMNFKEVKIKAPFLFRNKNYNLDGIHHFSFVKKNESLSYIVTDGLNNNFYKSFKI